MDLTLDDLQSLVCHKTQTNKQPSSLKKMKERSLIFIYLFIYFTEKVGEQKKK